MQKAGSGEAGAARGRVARAVNTQWQRERPPRLLRRQQTLSMNNALMTIQTYNYYYYYYYYYSYITIDATMLLSCTVPSYRFLRQ
jgi:hypothetical protein